MRRNNRLSLILTLVCAAFGGANAKAACVLPNQLANGQTADATQIMDNFNGMVNCLYAAPSGPANALQFNAGGGSFAGVGPLTNGQLVIGSTGGAPQAQTLTAGPGIAIANGPGSVTIAATGGGGNGLYSQVMSPTPNSAWTGLTNWLNQGSATVSENAVGISVSAPAASGGNANITGRYMPAPTPPYKITALIAGTRNSSAWAAVGIGWYDGASKLHLLSHYINGGTASVGIQSWNGVASFNTSDVVTNNLYSQPIWLQIQDDGINVSFGYSQDGVNFLPLFTTAKSSGFLGASGYNNVIFWVNPQNGPTIGTLMSWAQN